MPSLGNVSDRISVLVQPLRKLLAGTGLAETPARPADPVRASKAEDDLVEIDRILILLARPTGSREHIRLMTRQMNIREALFTTRGTLSRGEEVHVQMLLEPGFALQVSGRVEEIQRVEGGESRGRLALYCGPFERGALTSYLSKRNARVLP